MNISMPAWNEFKAMIKNRNYIIKKTFFRVYLTDLKYSISDFVNINTGI